MKIRQLPYNFGNGRLGGSRKLSVRVWQTLTREQPLRPTKLKRKRNARRLRRQGEISRREYLNTIRV